MYRVPKYFTSKRLSLPKALSLGTKKLTIDYMKTTDSIEETFALLNQCAENGFNIGLDEFTYDVHEYNVERSENFIIRDAETSSLQGMITLRPAAEGRSVAPCVVRFTILLSPPLQSMANFGVCVDLATDIARDLELNYSTCLMKVFSSCPKMVEQLARRAFHIVATLPFSGKVPRKGLVETFIMVKTISDKIYPLRPWEDLVKHVKDNLEEGEDPELLNVSFLPITYTLRDGRHVTVRNLRDLEEGKDVHDLLRESAAKANGFAVDEYPTFQLFKEWVLGSCYTIILEDTTSGELIALFTIGNSQYSRTQDVYVCDTNVLVRPEVAGAGIGQEMCEIYTGLSKDLGFRITMSDVFYFNEPIFRIARRIGYFVMGAMPKVSYVEGHGWVDGLLVFKDLNNAPSFTEMKANQVKQQSDKDVSSQIPSVKM